MKIEIESDRHDPEPLIDELVHVMKEMLKPNRYSVQDRVNVLGRVGTWALEQAAQLRAGDRDAALLARFKELLVATDRVDEALAELRTQRDLLLNEVVSGMGDRRSMTESCAMSYVDAMGANLGTLRAKFERWQQTCAERLPSGVDRLANVGSEGS